LSYILNGFGFKVVVMFDTQEQLKT